MKFILLVKEKPRMRQVYFGTGHHVCDIWTVPMLNGEYSWHGRLMQIRRSIHIGLREE